MEYIFSIFIIFMDLLVILIFADVILSWLTLFWLKLRPQFIASVIDPLYHFVKKIIPTSIGPIDFTPIVILFVFSFLVWIVTLFFPELAGAGIFFFKN